MMTAKVYEENVMVANRKGFTLIELIAVIVILGVLMTIAMTTFQDSQRRSDVEQKVKKMYSDLMSARLRAVQRGRDHFVTMANGATQYSLYEDGPAPDGDGTFITANETLISTQSIAPYTFALSAASLSLVQFNSKGLVVGTTGWVRINTTVPGEYDCVVIEQIKTGMGQMNGANCIVK